MKEGLLTDLYYDEIFKIINEIRATERENILKAARASGTIGVDRFKGYIKCL